MTIKKYIDWMAFAMMAILAITFSSCDTNSVDDDDDKDDDTEVGGSTGTKSDLVGTWYGTFTATMIGPGMADTDGNEYPGEEITGEAWEYLQFRADGTAVNVGGSELEDEIHVDFSIWSVKGNKLIIYGVEQEDGSNESVVDIVKVTDEELIIYSPYADETFTYTRVSDDAIKQYLE